MAVQDRQFEAEPLRVARGWVRRESLFDRLGDPAAGGVVLVCAPAGSGKTVLLRSWVEAAGLRDRVGWVSVERGEKDAQRFWLSVIDALAAAVPGRGAGGPGAELPRRGGGRAAAGGPRHRSRSPPCSSSTTCTSSSPPRRCAGSRCFLARRPRRAAGGAGHARGPAARSASPAPGGRADRAARERPALLRRGDEGAAAAKPAIALSDAGVARLYERTEGWVAGLAARGHLARPPPGSGALRERSSRAASGPWRATCWPRCWSASPPRCASCCCGRRCSSASAARWPTI